MEPITHQAKWVILDPDQILENGYVTEKGGRILAVGKGKPPGDSVVRDHGEGVLMPALVNAHTHLDLTPLAGQVKTGNGFIPWVKEVVRHKSRLKESEIKKGITDGIELLRKSGCALAGDHRSFPIPGPSGEVEPVLQVFREYLGSHLDVPVDGDGDGFHSFAAHAPHTTAPWLILHLKELCRKNTSVFSIHVAESNEESEFIASGRGFWAVLLKERGIEFHNWGIPAESPVRHLQRLDVLDEQTLAVHLVQSDKSDLALLAEKGVRVCVCPRSNKALINELPDVQTMLDLGLRPAIGTDSLASVSSLDLFEEMRFLAGTFPGLSPRDILAMGTLNGAIALGSEMEWGSLAPGKRAAMLFVPVDGKDPASLLENLISDHRQTVAEWAT